MFDVNDDAKGEFRRVEVLTGPVRRRRWSAEEKARIVEETLAPGARVSEVARRCQVCSQQVFTWQRAAYRAAPTAPTVRDFVPIMAETANSASVVCSDPTPPAIEIKLADDLNRQLVCEIRAYCPRRWPGQTFAAGKPRIVSIRYEAVDGRTNAGKIRREGMAPVPQESVQGMPEEEMER